MGAEYSGTIRNELLSSKKLVGYTPEQVLLLKQKFNIKCDDELSLNKKEFASMMKISDEDSENLFKLFDIDGSKTIDSYELLTSVALLGYSSLKVVLSD